MILTVTPNTALDHVLVVDSFEHGARLEVAQHFECIGGKGNLVSAFAADFGARSVSLGFAAGQNGRRLAELLRRRGVRPDFSPAGGETRRINVVVDAKRRQQTWLVSETLRVTRQHERDLEKRVAKWLPKASWLALCGSFPPGCSRDLFVRLVNLAHDCGVPALIDSRRIPLLQVLRHRKARPEVLKLNHEELAATLDIREPAKSEFTGVLVRTGARAPIELVICTMGPRGAIAMALSSNARWLVRPPVIRQSSSAGSGDAFTAALLVWREKGADWPEALRWACAAGTAKALEDRTDHLDLDRVRTFYRRVKIKKLSRP